MFGLGMGELLIIGGVCLLLFGGKKLPQLGSSMGKAIVNFKEGLNGQNKTDKSHKTIDEDY